MSATDDPTQPEAGSGGTPPPPPTAQEPTPPPPPAASAPPPAAASAPQPAPPPPPTAQQPPAGGAPPPGTYVPPAAGGPPPGGRKGSKAPLIIGIVAVVAVLGAGIAFFALRGDDETTTTDTTAVTDTTTGSDSTDIAAGAVDNIDDVRGAVVQIVSQGAFRDPETGETYSSAGAGSGFIIDPSGIVVTNNHVVTGGATYQVYVQGEDRPRNAQVIGASECYDVAVLQLSGEGDLPFLSWYDGDVEPGLNIYVAGFPLGDPEYTLVEGIISKAEADGDTSWASLDFAYQHDASAQPGNSGGPVVTEDGQVVGIHYSAAEAVNAAQLFAIPTPLARPVIEEMLDTEQDFESIGVNGSAVADPESGLSGIWVASVKSGSPADEVGIEAGDIITTLEGLPMATDGTMADYCDVLRSRNATDPLAVEVLRFDTQEVLRGELNGPPLELAFSFADEFNDQTQDAPSTYTDYTTISDDSGALQVSVPVEWADVDGAPQEINGVQAPSVWAAPDLQSFVETWGTPGMKFYATDQFDPTNLGAVLDSVSWEGQCTYGGREDYTDPVYTGQFDVWTDCGESGAQYFVLAATPADGSYVAVVEVQVVTDADLEALDTILQTFQRVA